MGISFNQNNAFTITDRFGDTKFSLDKRMPHIFAEFSGIVSVPKIYKSGVDINTIVINRTDDVVTLSNSYISVNYEDSLILPFYKITGGVSDTNNKIVSGTGSTIIRKIFV